MEVLKCLLILNLWTRFILFYFFCKLVVETFHRVWFPCYMKMFVLSFLNCLNFLATVLRETESNLYSKFARI